MLKINGKTFMNLQEAVQWLLDNNALPFQSSANYVANTEIGMGTIVNPSPAKVRIGSLIFFADSKVSTVVGLTENGFIVSDQYNDLVDDVVYVSNVALNASGHLIVTLSNGDNIDAGLIKQVTGFSINGSQHLIVSFNDGTSTDLGAIFSGNITISGDLTVTGSINGEASPSVKPIYYHPIMLWSGASTPYSELRIFFAIFDNNPTPYNPTTLIAKLKNLMDLGAVINCNGYVMMDDTLKSVFKLSKDLSNYVFSWFISGSTIGNAGDTNLDTYLATIYSVTDGVNKIN